jgi:hypothetical protein
MSKAEKLDHGDPTEQAGGCLDSVTGLNRAQAPQVSPTWWDVLVHALAGKWLSLTAAHRHRRPRTKKGRPSSSPNLAPRYLARKRGALGEPAPGADIECATVGDEVQKHDTSPLLVFTT